MERTYPEALVIPTYQVKITQTPGFVEPTVTESGEGVMTWVTRHLSL